MKRCLVVLCTMFCLGGFAQQKAMFTQYMFNGLAINPAYSALDEALSFTAVARQQWTGFKGAPNTQSFTVHSPIKESNSSAGLMFMRDQIGEVITENGAFLTFAQRVQIGENTYLAAGVNAGISKYVANYSLISNANTALDPVFADGDNMRGNFGLGVMMFSDKFYAGISSPFFYYRDLGSTSATRTAYRSHYMMQGGYLTDLSESVKFKPNVLLKYVNGAPLEIDLNANFLLKEILWLGTSWRSFDSFDAIAEIQLGPNIQVGYSYDFTTTDLSKVENGSHEVMLNFRFPIKGRSFPRCYF